MQYDWNRIEIFSRETTYSPLASSSQIWYQTSKSSSELGACTAVFAWPVHGCMLLAGIGLDILGELMYFSGVICLLDDLLADGDLVYTNHK